MNRKVSIASVAALIAAAGSASARNYSGSDTLRVFTQTLVSQCGAVGGGATYPALAGTPQFTYIGGGSTAGGNDMRAGEQDIAPQSRFLNTAEACETAIEANPSTGAGNLGNDEAALTISPAGSGAEGLVIALDGMSIAVSPTSGARCDTTPGDGFAAPLAHSSAKSFFVTDFANDGLPRPASLPVNPANPAQSIYTYSNFQDVLRILFSGADSTRANNVTEGGGNSQRATNRVARCTSDVRRSLVSQWDNIIQADPATCTGQASCGTLRRLYRRADDSGTTDTFLTLLGLASVRGTGNVEQEPFCNGLERQDNDPVRRTCLAADDVCGPLPTGMGLVQAVELYQIQNVTGAPAQLAANYPTQACTTGIFVLRNAPVLPNGSSATTCPDGAPQILGQCLTPQIGPATATGTAIGGNCLNSQFNTSFLTPGGNDGRAWNRELRSSAGNMRNELIQGQSVPSGITNAVHRTRSRAGQAQCILADATLNIGCTAGNVACALGFAGREATDNPSNPVAVAAPVGNVAPTITNIQNASYPLSRKLYFNSILGFDQIRDEVPAVAANAEQEQLVRCLENEPAAHAAAIAASGFIDLPNVTPTGDEVEFRVGPAIGTTGSASPGLLCQDVNEQALCGAPSDAPNCTLL